MNDVWLRLGIVGVAVLLILLTALALRLRSSVWSRIEAEKLEPGVYLFSSSTCVDCVAARDRLRDALGASGFVEIEWEHRPELFGDLGIDLVPTTLVVAADGSAALYPGQPDRALESLNP